MRMNSTWGFLLPKLRNMCTLRVIGALLLSQLLSGMLTGTGICSTFLVQQRLNIPTTQSFVHYVSLAFCYTLILMYTTRKFFVFRYTKVPFWKYAFIALADVEGNYLAVKAYQYTSITSVMLLDCFVIPFVMILSRILLKRKYKATHIIGVVTCVAGMVTLVISDFLITQSNDTSGESSGVDVEKVLFGDMLCILASVCYAVSNVGQEYFVKRSMTEQQQPQQQQQQQQSISTLVINIDAPIESSAAGGDQLLQRGEDTDRDNGLNRKRPEPLEHDVIEFLSMIGIFGAIINGTQLAILEHNEIANIRWTWSNITPFLGFYACLFLFYSLTPYLLRLSSATFMNLSFMTSDVFAVIVNVFLFHNSLHPLFYLALVAICVGLAIYNIQPEVDSSIPPETTLQLPNDNTDEQPMASLSASPDISSAGHSPLASDITTTTSPRKSPTATTSPILVHNERASETLEDNEKLRLLPGSDTRT